MPPEAGEKGCRPRARREARVGGVRGLCAYRVMAIRCHDGVTGDGGPVAGRGREIESGEAEPYWAGFLGIVGLALPSTLMTSCGL